MYMYSIVQKIRNFHIYLKLLFTHFFALSLATKLFACTKEDSNK